MADVRHKIAKQLRELLETTDPGLRETKDDAFILRHGLEVIAGQLEAGLVPGPTLAEVRQRLITEGMPANGAEYVARVLDKMGLP